MTGLLVSCIGTRTGCQSIDGKVIRLPQEPDEFTEEDFMYISPEGWKLQDGRPAWQGCHGDVVTLEGNL